MMNIYWLPINRLFTDLTSIDVANYPVVQRFRCDAMSRQSFDILTRHEQGAGLLLSKVLPILMMKPFVLMMDRI